MNVKELTKKLVQKPNTSNEPLAVQQRRKYRNSGGSISGFARINGSAKAGDIAGTAITAERLAGIGFDSDTDTDTTGFKKSNRDSHAATAERRRQNRQLVNAAIERNGQGTVEDAEPEDQEFFEAEESTPVEERRHSRPVGLEEVNQEYARRRGYQLPRVS